MEVERPNSIGKSGSSHTQPAPHHSQHSHLPRDKLMQCDPLMLCLLVPSMAGSFDNFHVPCSDACKAYMEVATGVIQLFISVACIPAVMFPRRWNLSAVSLNVRIFRETTVIVILSYVLLLDIDVTYLWIVIFPSIAILFIYALSTSAARRSSSSNGCKECDEEKTTSTPMGLTLMVMVPFMVLFAMAQLLPDDAVNRFSISQFLLFTGTTLAAITRMMRKLSVCMPPQVAQASELLHKISLVVLLLTAHTVAAELLGEPKVVILTFMLELAPVLLWFTLHLDRHYSIFIVSVNEFQNYTIGLFLVLSMVICWACQKIPSLLSSNCTTVFMSCWVSGFLSCYLLFMLHEWRLQESGKEEADALDQVSKVIGSSDQVVQSENQVTKGIESLDKDVQSKKQVGMAIESSGTVMQPEKGQAGFFKLEGVQLLQFWAGSLLMVAFVLALMLLYLVGPYQIFNLQYLSNPLYQMKKNYVLPLSNGWKNTYK